MTHSSAARAAVEGYTRALAEEWAAARHRASSPSPPATSTRRRCASTPSRSGARPLAPSRSSGSGARQEHAWLVALCCSPLGAALSGSVVTLDGARDNWFGPWPPASLAAEGGEVPTEARGPKPPGA